MSPRAHEFRHNHKKGPQKTPKFMGSLPHDRAHITCWLGSGCLSRELCVEKKVARNRECSLLWELWDKNSERRGERLDRTSVSGKTWVSGLTFGLRPELRLRLNLRVFLQPRLRLRPEGKFDLRLNTGSEYCLRDAGIRR